MAKVNQIRHFVDRNVERQLVREYLLKETERAGFGGLHFERAFDQTSICTKVTLQAERVGMVIGRRGKVINELQRRIRTDFNLENPKLQVEEIENPALNAQVMASKLASALERGWYFRRAGHSSVLNVIEAGAKGCLIIIAGKLTGSRHRTEKFLKGHIKFCGETALTHMDVGQATAVVKLGTIGCTVAIMKPGTKLPHEVDIISRIDAGLGPYIAPAMAGTEGTEDIVEESLSEEKAAEELASLEKLQEEQEAVVDTTEEVATNKGVIARWNPDDWPESDFQEHITSSGSTEGLTWKCNLTKISEGSPVVILGPKNSEYSGIVAIGQARGSREKKTGLTKGSEETWRIDVSLRSANLDISVVKEILGDEIEDTVQGANYLDSDHFNIIEQAIRENTEAVE